MMSITLLTAALMLTCEVKDMSHDQRYQVYLNVWNTGSLSQSPCEFLITYCKVEQLILTWQLSQGFSSEVENF